MLTLALWLALQAVTIGFAIAFGLRDDLGMQLRRPVFALEVGLSIISGSVPAQAQRTVVSCWRFMRFTGRPSRRRQPRGREGGGRPADCER